MRRVAITMGEPGGVGPEVALKAAMAVRDVCVPALVGDIEVFAETAKTLNLPVSLKAVDEIGKPEADTIQVIDAGRAGDFKIGRPTAAGGRASAEAIRRALALAVEGRVHALVTAPISKEALKLASLPWPGHTEMLAELTSTKDYAMMLVGGGLRVLLVTIHVALEDVPPLITRRSVLKSLRLARRAAKMLDINSPRIAVAGLNPHAGEGGMFGREEEEAIAPAMRDAASEGVPASGPHPPDTVFFRALRGEFDMVVAMYHDQGLIPVKLLAFETGVNATVGLPVIRTSPDHGTAYDIAGKGLANPSSTIEAVRLALRMKL